jgi:hypothetical protein
MTASLKKNAVCNTCTIRLVNIAYRRASWFRLLREPLKFGMRILAWAHHVNPGEYEVRTDACYGCIRFYKVALKEKSGLFRFLNDQINPLFDAMIEQIVSPAEIHDAKGHARAAMAGQVDPNDNALITSKNRRKP